MRWFARALAALGLLSAMLVGGGAAAETRSAIFAGGCFWCMEAAFDEVPGVIATTSGYTGGKVKNPTYKQVSAGGTGHYESVKVDYNPARVTYAQLLDHYWHNIDPFATRGQFCDHGSQYRAVIFVADAEQKKLAEQTKAAVAKRFHAKVTTRILPEQTFYPAEAYHQNFHVTHKSHYEVYKYGCGRPQRLEQLWGKPAA